MGNHRIDLWPIDDSVSKSIQSKTKNGLLSLIDGYKMHGLDDLLTFLGEAKINEPAYNRTHPAVRIVIEIQWPSERVVRIVGFDAVNWQWNNARSSYVRQTNIANPVRIFGDLRRDLLIPRHFLRGGSVVAFPQCHILKNCIGSGRRVAGIN